jgi:hypothetical protein
LSDRLRLVWSSLSLSLCLYGCPTMSSLWNRNSFLVRLFRQLFTILFVCCWTTTGVSWMIAAILVLFLLCYLNVLNERRCVTHRWFSRHVEVSFWSIEVAENGRINGEILKFGVL